MKRLADDREGRLIAGGLATLLVPVSIVAHEGGHFLGNLLFRFPSPRLHYASAGWDGIREFTLHMQAGEFAAAQAMADIVLAGIANALGPLVGYLAIGLGLWALHRFESIAGAAPPRSWSSTAISSGPRRPPSRWSRAQ